jgi:putative nucleotidyltransferase with HDIG domain
MEKPNQPSGSVLGSKLKLALNNLGSLPAMPAIAQKLLALQLDTDKGEAQMLVLIEQDPQIFARVIGLANSSAMGVGRKINNIKSASMLLGMKRLKAVAIGIATMSKMANQPAAKNFDPHDLWSHSMTIAMVMNAIAREMPQQIRPDENQIFLAGLLHDIGLMALHFLDLEASEELHRQLRLQPRRSICELEMELFGMTHGHIGALLVQHWKLPKEIIEVVGLHHSLDISNLALGNPLVRLVNIAEKLLPDFGIAEHTYDPIAESEWCELCVNPALAEKLSELANELAMQIVQLPDSHDVTPPVINISEESDVVLPQKEDGQCAAQHIATAVHAVSCTADKASFSIIFAPARALVKWIRGLLR